MKRTSIAGQLLFVTPIVWVAGCQSVLGIDDVVPWDGGPAKTNDGGSREGSSTDASVGADGDARASEVGSSEGAASDGGSADGSDGGGQCPPGSTNCAAGCHAGDTRSCGH